MLGIYGDSYAEPVENKTSWIDYLNKKYRSFSKGGSSIDYSYYKFCETHTQFDKIIFVVSNFDRGSIFTLDNNKPVHLAFYQNTDIEDLKFSNINKMDKNEHKLYKKYSKDIWQTVDAEIEKVKIFDSNIMYHNAYIDSIKYQRPDAHIVYAFPFPNRSDVGMINISRLDWNYLNLSEHDDFRLCHMSDAQNQEFAYYMTEHINGKLDIHSTMVSPENYYTVSKTLKQANWTEI
jgi:hypothetical protein